MPQAERMNDPPPFPSRPLALNLGAIPLEVAALSTSLETAGHTPLIGRGGGGDRLDAALAWCHRRAQARRQGHSSDGEGWARVEA